MAPLHRHLWTFMLLLALHLQASAAAMVTSAFTKALAKPKPVVVHLYDPKPADLKEYALADLSIVGVNGCDEMCEDAAACTLELVSVSAYIVISRALSLSRFELGQSQGLRGF